MKVLGKELRNIYCGKTLVGKDTIYIIDQLPKEEDYIEIENHKGYVVSYNYEDEDKYYSIYLEKNLGDWNNQIIDVCDVVCVDIKGGIQHGI